MNEPKADLNALFVSWLLLINSPASAPTNGPTMIPKGGKKNSPATSPMVAPHTPALVPPNFLVPQIGI